MTPEQRVTLNTRRNSRAAVETALERLPKNARPAALPPEISLATLA